MGPANALALCVPVGERREQLTAAGASPFELRLTPGRLEVAALHLFTDLDLFRPMIVRSALPKR